jgi:hypothetical protein
MNAVDRIQDGTGRLEARMMQKDLKQKILREYLENIMRMWDNTKMDVKETSFVFRHNSSLQHGAKRDFRKVIDVIFTVMFGYFM